MNFPYPEMSTIITNTGAEHPKTNAEMTCIEKKKIDKSIHHKLSKKDAYGTDIHKIYNIIVSQTNK